MPIRATGAAVRRAMEQARTQAMSDYFAAKPDHAILVGLIGFFALCYFLGRSGRKRRRPRDRAGDDLYRRMLRGEGRDDRSDRKESRRRADYADDRNNTPQGRGDRKSGVSGKRVSGCVEIGGWRMIIKIK